jgi:hypothetical protein
MSVIVVEPARGVADAGGLPLGFLATVPLPAVDAAVRELDRRRAVVLVHPGPLPGPAVGRLPGQRRRAVLVMTPRRVTHGRSPAADSGEIRTGPPDPRRRRGTAWPAHQRRQW